MKKVFFASTVLVLSMLLFSCSNFFSASSSDNEGVPNGKARVHFSVGKSGARTIMPESYTEEDIKLIELTAQKKGEETAYKFNGEKEKLSWNSLSELEKASIDIDYGTYTFVLNLSINEGDKNFLVQTCTLEDQAINAETKELAFNMQEDSGDISISISWGFDGDINRIGKIDAGLYTIASKGETPLDITGDTAEKTLTISVDGASATAKGSYSSVPSGSYLIKLRLYDTETAENPLNTITDIIKINGYKTLYNLVLDLDKLNIQYTAIFNPNGGTWEDGSTGAKATSRNMYSGFVPPDGVSKTDFELVGWYVFEDDVPSEDLSKATSSDLLDPDKDYTLYAVWGHSVGGSFTTDNRALIIKTDAGKEIYQNSKIHLSVTDSAGEPVTDGVTYDAKILYKGKDINGLTGGDPYYSVEGNAICLHGLNNPLPKEKYQLYVTASRELSGASNSVTSSQTFNVKLLDGIETQIALYNYNSNTSTYNYYLTDSANVKTAALDGTADFTSSKDNFVFDAAGNIYNLNDDKELVSNNELITNRHLSMSSDLSGSSVKEYGFTVDLATNIAYGYVLEQVYNSGSYTYNLNVYKYPKLISDGSLEQKTSMNKNDITLKSGYKVSINNNLLYLYGTADYTNYKVIVYDISSGSMAQFSEFNVTEYLTASERDFASTTESGNISVNDIFATEGALYLLVQEKVDVKSTTKDIYRRGSVIKYIPTETSNGTGTRFLAVKTTPAISKTAISNMALYYDSATNGNASGPLYAVAGTNNVSPSGRETVVTIENVGKTLAFPDIYGVNETEKYLSAPAKVIAVKPKKLVIADDGCAFYTDSECLKYKNMNRIVTVDLEDFVVESVQTTTAEFSSNISSYLKTNIAINTLEEIKTSQEDGHYFESSAKEWDSATIEGIKNQLYLAVKPGE